MALLDFPGTAIELELLMRVSLGSAVAVGNRSAPGFRWRAGSNDRQEGNTEDGLVGPQGVSTSDGVGVHGHVSAVTSTWWCHSSAGDGDI